MATSSSLPWLWIIEYLASFKETDMSALIDLIKRAPEFHTESGRNAREMVYLRVLESFLDWQARIERVSSALESKIKIDPLETCEDVVWRMVEEMSASSPRRNEPDLLNWDIQSFITYKSETMPKSTLLQLNDAFLERKHRNHASKKEKSGPSVDDGDCDVDVGKTKGSCGAVQPVAGYDLTSPEHKTSNGLVPEDLPDKTLLTSKRSRSDVGSENQTAKSSGFNSLNNGGDVKGHCSKKHKLCAASSEQAVSQDYVYATGNEMPEEDGGGHYIASKGFGQSNDGGLQYSNPCSSCKNNITPQDVSGDGTHQNLRVFKVKSADMQFLNKGTSDTAPLHRISQNSLDEEARGKDENDIHNMDRYPLLDVSYDFRDETKDQLENNPGEELRIDTSSYQDKKTDVAMMKDFFVSSQQSLKNHLPSVADYGAEPNICVTCGKGGQLLICTTTACPWAVHLSCLSVTPSFDDSGNFHCPFCAYRNADFGRMEAKKKVFVAQKDLAVFLMLENVDQVHKISEGFVRQDKNLLSDNVTIIKTNDRANERGKYDEREGVSSAKLLQVGVLQESRQSDDCHDHYIASKGCGERDGTDLQHVRPYLSLEDSNIPQPTSESLLEFSVKEEGDCDNFVEVIKSDVAPHGETDQNSCGVEVVEFKKSKQSISFRPLIDGSDHISDVFKDEMEHFPGGQVSDASYYNQEENIDVAMMKHSFLISQSAIQLDSLLAVDGTECNICMKCNLGGHALVCSANACPSVVHQSCLGSTLRLDDSGNFYCPFCSYHRAIQRYVKAKKKVFLTRKNLSLFVWSEKAQQAKNYLCPDMNQSRQNDNVARSDRANQDKLLSEPSVSCGEDATNNDPLHGVPKGDRKANKIGQECLSLSLLAVQQIRTHVGARDSSSCSRNTQLAVVSVANAEDEDATLQQPISVLPLQAWLPNNSKVEISDELNDWSFFRYFTRHRNQEMQ